MFPPTRMVEPWGGVGRSVFRALQRSYDACCGEDDEIARVQSEQAAVDLGVVLAEQRGAAWLGRRRGHAGRRRRILERPGDGMIDGAEEAAIAEMRRLEEVRDGVHGRDRRSCVASALVRLLFRDAGGPRVKLRGELVV